MASSWAAAAFFAPIHDSDRDRRDSQSDDSTTSRALRLRESAFIRAGAFMPPSSPRIGAGAVTMSACAEFAALAASRATMRNLRASTQPPPAFGAPDALPARASRAALSASAGSFLSRPAILFSRLGLTTSTTS